MYLFSIGTWWAVITLIFYGYIKCWANLEKYSYNYQNKQFFGVPQKGSLDQYFVDLVILSDPLTEKFPLFNVVAWNR